MKRSEKPIYLDYNATTPIDLGVRNAMLPCLEKYFGNPSSSYVYGQRAREAVEKARGQVATLIGATPEEIIFTSGGTESDNHAIIGVTMVNTQERKHIITSRVEHPAVLSTCRYLEARLGFRVTYLAVDRYGLVDPEDIRRAITKDTILITIMHASNEVGTIEPIEEIGKIAQENEILSHTDAAAACDIAKNLLMTYPKDSKFLRDKLHTNIEMGLGKDAVRLNGHPERRLPNTLNISLHGVVGEELLSRIPEIAASTGAACHAGSTEPSSVLLEMGLSREWALGARRLTVGRWTTSEEIAVVSKLIVERAREFVVS